MTSLTINRTDAFLNDLETIVNIDSSSENLEGVAAVARFFESRLKALGMQVEIQRVGENQVPCLFAAGQEAAEPYDVMFLGHMDTVFPRGEALRRPFSRDDSRAYGPGVCDMKGGLLVALHTLELMAASGALKDLSCCVLFNGDEEVGSDASAPLIAETAKKSGQVFVFEPCRPEYRFVLRRKGGGWFFVEAKGRSAHAGADPEKGSNAVHEIAAQVMKIHQLNDPETGTSAQVTVISGGDKVNIIPHTARAAVDVRISRASEKARVEGFFNALPDQTVVDGVCLTVKGSIERPPMEPDNQALAIWEVIRAKAAEIGVSAEYISTGGCSDGNTTSAAGTPTIDGMGTVGANSHSVDEYIEIESINKMLHIVYHTCMALIREKGQAL